VYLPGGSWDRGLELSRALLGSPLEARWLGGWRVGSGVAFLPRGRPAWNQRRQPLGLVGWAVSDPLIQVSVRFSAIGADPFGVGAPLTSRLCDEGAGCSGERERQMSRAESVDD
jgi:hypothetical protein